MIIEVTQIITRFYGHPTVGVNVLIPGIPREKVDGSGTWPAPDSVALYDDTMKDVIDDRLELEPPSTPSLITYCDGSAQVKFPGYSIARSLTMVTAYCTQDVPADVAKREGGIALRAVEQCLERFNHQQFSVGYKELNKICVAKVESVTQLGIAGAVGRSKMWGLVLFTLTAIEKIS